MFQQWHPDTEPALISDAPPAATDGVATVAPSDPRRRLLASMIQTVALRGYDRATVSRALSNANVLEAVFSEHFHDKHDCFLQALDDLIARVEVRASELFLEPTPWAERVCKALEELLDALACHPDAARVTFVEMLGAGPAACKRQRQALALFRSLIEEGRCQASSDLHLPAQTSEAIVGGIVSILHRRILEGATAELPKLHAELTYFALLPYLDHERALAAAGLERT